MILAAARRVADPGYRSRLPTRSPEGGRGARARAGRLAHEQHGWAVQERSFLAVYDALMAPSDAHGQDVLTDRTFIRRKSVVMRPVTGFSASVDLELRGDGERRKLNCEARP